MGRSRVTKRNMAYMEDDVYSSSLPEASSARAAKGFVDFVDEAKEGSLLRAGAQVCQER